METVRDLVEYTRRLVRKNPSPPLSASVRKLALQFQNRSVCKPGSGLNFFSFHLDVPAKCRVIDYVDVKHDHGAFNYTKLSQLLAWSIGHFHPDSKIWFVTDLHSRCALDNSNATVVRLPLDPAAPMLERVKAMAAYVQSNAFDRDTIFLDTDAFPNRNLQQIFRRRFDVGVTYRATPEFMPINEGVIFCSAREKSAVCSFFQAYLATYEALLDDPRVLNYYGNIRRWRGGQLSLSALYAPSSLGHGDFMVSGARVAVFPCDQFNYWVTEPTQFRGDALSHKFILHLKGDSKFLVDDMIKYHHRINGGVANNLLGY